jgi:hypothetical protein
VIGQPTMGDGEQPRAKGRLVTSEVPKPAGDAQPGFGRQVLRFGRDPRVEVAQKGGVELVVEDAECPLLAVLGRRQDGLELFSESHVWQVSSYRAARLSP